MDSLRIVAGTTLVWLAIAACFIRGIFVFDMGTSAQNNSYPVASGLCLAGSVIAAAIMMVFHAMMWKIDKNK
ncbi:MAG TPA: hypothetical protein PLE92_07005 [Lentisphaeria bacterium]|nr:hypothetical protein [Lentisphaeria bacterium]